MSIQHQALADTPIAVVDLETTGLSPYSDRIVEISVVRLDPGAAPRVVLDTLVDPQRRVSCSEIHGIYDEDVIGAPLFHELIDPLAAALDGAVVAAFNVYFDMRFLLSEFSQARLAVQMPHLCLMWLRPALEMGTRECLGSTCAALGVRASVTHQASTDAMAAASLWPRYVTRAHERGVRTFGELAALRDYKFFLSFSNDPLSRAALSAKPLRTALKPRRVRSTAETSAVRRRENQGGAYFEAIKDAMIDGDITAEEVKQLRYMQADLRLTDDHIRYVHTRILAGVLDDVSRDMQVDAAEVAWLGHVSDLLRRLGWSPGDAIATKPDAAAPPAVSDQAVVVPTQPASWYQRMFTS